MDKAVLLITWKRAREVTRLIASLRDVKPTRVYIASDGPANDAESMRRVSQTRSIMEAEIDWPCEVFRLYSQVNMGCGRGVVKAIDWFFQHECEGLILEEDCIPDASFYRFCCQMLDRFRNEESIWSISGSCFVDGTDGHCDYYFSQYTHIWGWATWRSAWQMYEADIKSWDNREVRKTVLNNISRRNSVKRYWKRVFNGVRYLNEPDTWDYQWQYTLARNKGLTVIPRINLVDNIGFSDDATHTKERIVDTDAKTLPEKISDNLSIGIVEDVDDEIYRVCHKRARGWRVLAGELNKEIRILSRRLAMR